MNAYNHDALLSVPGSKSKKIAIISVVVVALMVFSAVSVFAASDDSSAQPADKDVIGISDLVDSVVSGDKEKNEYSFGEAATVTVSLDQKLTVNVDKDALFKFVSQFRMLEVNGVYVMNDGKLDNTAAMQVVTGILNQMTGGFTPVSGSDNLYTAATLEISYVLFDNGTKGSMDLDVLVKTANSGLVNSLNSFFQMVRLSFSDKVATLNIDLRAIPDLADDKSAADISEMTVIDAFDYIFTKVDSDKYGILESAVKYIKENVVLGSYMPQVLYSLQIVIGESVLTFKAPADVKASDNIFDYVIKNHAGAGWDNTLGAYYVDADQFFDISGKLLVTYNNMEGKLTTISLDMSGSLYYPVKGEAAVSVDGNNPSVEAVSQAISILKQIKSEDKALVITSTSTQGSNTIALSADVVKVLKDSGVKVEFTSTQGTDAVTKVTFSPEAVASIPNDGKDIKVTFIQNPTLSPAQKERVSDKTTLEVDLLIGGTPYHGDIDGSITVSSHYVPKATDDLDDITVFFIADNGTTEKMDTTYDEVTSSVVFEVNHFSVYYVDFPEEAQDYALILVAIGAIIAVLAIAGILVIRQRTLADL